MPRIKKEMIKINKENLKPMLEEIQTAYSNYSEEDSLDNSFIIVTNKEMKSTGFINLERFKKEKDSPDVGLYDVESVISALENNIPVYCNFTTCIQRFVGYEVTLIKSISNDNILFINFDHYSEKQKESKIKELKNKLSKEEFDNLIISDENKRTIKQGNFSSFGFILSKNEEGEYITKFGQFKISRSGLCHLPDTISILKPKTLDEFDSVILKFLEKYKI